MCVTTKLQTRYHRQGPWSRGTYEGRTRKNPNPGPAKLPLDFGMTNLSHPSFFWQQDIPKTKVGEWLTCSIMIAQFQTNFSVHNQAYCFGLDQEILSSSISSLGEEYAKDLPSYPVCSSVTSMHCARGHWDSISMRNPESPDACVEDWILASLRVSPTHLVISIRPLHNIGSPDRPADENISVMIQSSKESLRKIAQKYQIFLKLPYFALYGNIYDSLQTKHQMWLLSLEFMVISPLHGSKLWLG